MSTHRMSVQSAAKIGTLALGPLLALLVFIVLPESETLTYGARATAAMVVWMAVWWITEAIPLPATSLIPIVVLPAAGIMSTSKAAAPYANELIFLFLGGFVLGIALEKWNAHKRIALSIILLVGTSPRAIIGGFMLATAILSMAVSNTATVIMLLPIGVSVIALVNRAKASTDDRHSRNFAIAMMLGIAYAASIGGVATINGTPPNGILIAFLKDATGVEISYFQWLRFGLPLVCIMLPLTWLVLTRLIFPVGRESIAHAGQQIRNELKALGPMSRGEITVLVVFSLTAAAWITRGWLAPRIGFGPGSGREITDAGIALVGALALFVIPINLRQRSFAMDWESAVRLPWGVLLLFGGGLSLAGAVRETGLDAAIGSTMASLGQPPILVLILTVAILTIFMTELTSNTAVTSAFLPVLAAASTDMGISAVALCIPAAVCASMAFMLPVATPPNAIVFSSGHVTIRQMVKAGFWLNIIGAVVITLFVIFLGPILLGALTLTP
ncbi:MAG: DASS family sodium-coupled anion symporter [Phycisphaeraceae bacterium]|nr:DASS family sodium-coupled anion symporter [Phycisphaeraceae bacterium]MCW5761858.1 DASS family sodium-coupled anion symporter [Phycisphaeraceae bacterium]